MFICVVMTETKFTSNWRLTCRKCEGDVPIDSYCCPHCGVRLSETISIVSPILIYIDEDGNRVERNPSVEELEYFLMIKERLDRIWPYLFGKRILDESKGNAKPGSVHWMEENALDRILEERLQYSLRNQGRPPHAYRDGVKWKSDWKRYYRRLRERGLPISQAVQLAEKKTEERGIDQYQGLGSRFRLRIEDVLGL